MALQNEQVHQQQSITDKSTQAAIQTSGRAAKAGSMASGGFANGEGTQDDSATTQASDGVPMPEAAAGLTPAVATTAQVCLPYLTCCSSEIGGGGFAGLQHVNFMLCSPHRAVQSTTLASRQQ